MNTGQFMRDFIGFRFALSGLVRFFKTERNGRIQGLIAIIIVGAGFMFHLSKMQWVAVLVCIGMVLGLEMVNSAIENVCNLITTEYHPQIKFIKDLSAGAVLLASVIAAIVGMVVFLPYIIHVFKY